MTNTKYACEECGHLRAKLEEERTWLNDLAKKHDRLLTIRRRLAKKLAEFKKHELEAQRNAAIADFGYLKQRAFHWLHLLDAPEKAIDDIEKIEVLPKIKNDDQRCGTCAHFSPVRKVYWTTGAVEAACKEPESRGEEVKVIMDSRSGKNCCNWKPE